MCERQLAVLELEMPSHTSDTLFDTFHTHVRILIPELGVFCLTISVSRSPMTQQKSLMWGLSKERAEAQSNLNGCLGLEPLVSLP